MLSQFELARLRAICDELETLAPDMEGFEAQQAVRTLRQYANGNGTKLGLQPDWRTKRYEQSVKAQEAENKTG